MGDVADAMLDGTLCQECGCYIGAECGYPLFCRNCGSVVGPGKESHRARRDMRRTHPNRRPVACPTCGKKFASEQARDQHVRDKHEKED